MDAFLDKAGGWIRVQEEHIWMMMFQITGDIGVPLCASLDIVLHLFETLPSFPANLTYQSNSPIICGFTPEAYAQPWLGLNSLDLAHTPPLNSHRKAKDILKEAILCSTGGSAATRVRTGLSTSTSTAPKQIGRDDKALPREGFPFTSSSAVCSPSKSPSPHHSWSGSSSSGQSLASEHRSRGSCLSSSSSSSLGSRSNSSSGSCDGSQAGSEAGAGKGSVHS